MQPVESAPQGFTGTISLKLPDLIQMVCLSRSDIIIEVISRKGKGSIHIKQGQIRHAMTDTLQGEQAFFEVLLWNDGKFEMLPFVECDVTSINKPWEHLILEAIRQQDEEKTEKGPGTNGTQAGGALSAEPDFGDLFGEVEHIFGNIAKPEEPSLFEEKQQSAAEVASSSTKVLIVDDSSFFSKKLREMLETDPAIEVVGVARNGKESLDYLDSGKPVDLITLDIEMPVMPGDTALKHIMIRHRVPALIISSLQPESMSKIFDFLQLGAVDFVTKPEAREDLASYAANLRELTKGAARARISNFKRLRKPGEQNRPPPIETGPAGLKILVIVGAEGAYMDWFRLPLRDLCRQGIVIGIQKLRDGFVPKFAQLIETRTEVKTKTLSATHSLSPGNFHLGNARRQAAFKLRPSESAMDLDLDIYGQECLEWKDGMQLWLDRLAQEARDSMSVYFLSAVDALPESLMANLLTCGVRFVLPPPQTVLCSQLVDSIQPYATHFPDQILFSSPDNLPEVLRQ
ncbi:MAG: response regulator [Syntrophobacteraceae bacterium]